MLLHGGDTVSYQLTFGHEPLDFSANGNPHGVPMGVRQAVIAALEHADRYPDPLCRELRARLSHHENLPKAWIRCGNGAADLIFRLILAERPQRALLLAPTFSEYEQALALIDCAITRHTLLPEHGFQVTRALLDEIERNQPDIIFLCNPNNPTGLLLEPTLLHEILITCSRQGTRLIVDECFNGFLDYPASHSLRQKIPYSKNLVVLDAFTKLYGIAGIRLGYALCSDEELLSHLDAAGQPWAVSSLAQAAGIAALDERDYVANTRALIATERVYLRTNLTTLGFEVFDGKANYLLLRSTVPTFDTLLKEHGILIRSCADYYGLDQTFFRVAVRTRAENETLLQAIRDITRRDL